MQQQKKEDWSKRGLESWRKHYWLSINLHLESSSGIHKVILFLIEVGWRVAIADNVELNVLYVLNLIRIDLKRTLHALSSTHFIVVDCIVADIGLQGVGGASETPCIPVGRIEIIAISNLIAVQIQISAIVDGLLVSRLSRKVFLLSASHRVCVVASSTLGREN